MTAAVVLDGYGADPRGAAAALRAAGEPLAEHLEDDYGVVGALFRIAPKSITLAWTGDVRACSLRDGVLRQHSRDHTLEYEVRENPDYPTHGAPPRRWPHLVTSSLGLAWRRPAVVGQADLPGDVQALLLISDGIYNVVDTEQITAFLTRVDDVEICARALVETTIEKVTLAARHRRIRRRSVGMDNATAMVIRGVAAP